MTVPSLSTRREIYYWKCDRPAAFHGTQSDRETDSLEPIVLQTLRDSFDDDALTLRDGGGQGNHLTWIAETHGRKLFVRVENGPEQSDQLEVESHVLDQVRMVNLPAPRVLRVDASRRQVPFAWQVMELIPTHDLNYCLKKGELQADAVAFDIGAAVATWQKVPVSGFGHFDPALLRLTGKLIGYHSTYFAYFRLQLERHLNFLVEHCFLSSDEASQIREAIQNAAPVLEIPQGCLVHKDLAFWNILGDASGIRAFIDWDDAISGDEMDDLSLLACFHDGSVIAQALAGYASVLPLPEEYATRFWLHLLRNMIVKSVIRVGAGYFERTDGFFLIEAGLTGSDLKMQTRTKLLRAVAGLRQHEPPEDL